MSVFIVSDQTINNIILRAYWHRGDNWAYPFIRQLKKAGYNLEGGETEANRAYVNLGMALRRINIKAYNIRYRKEENDITDIFMPTFDGPLPDIFQTLKSMQCWTYQCCDSQENDELYKIIEQAATQIMAELVGDMGGYKAAKWD